MLRNVFIAILLVCFALSCSRPEGAASLRDVVTRPVEARKVAAGLFHADSLLSFNAGMIDKTFGSRNIVVKPAGSGMEQSNYYVLILFPDSPKQIELVLEDSTKMARVKAVIIGQKSVWTTRAGVAPGMSLKELEALNGKPFLFYGGGWDQGGYVTNWKDGELHGKINSCRLDRNHIMPYDMSKGDYDAHEFASDSRDAQSGNPVVEEVTLSRF